MELIMDSDYIGMLFVDAVVLAAKRNLDCRIVSRDGKGSMVTMDYKLNRLNFSIDKGVVCEVSRG